MPEFAARPELFRVRGGSGGWAGIRRNGLRTGGREGKRSSPFFVPGVSDVERR